MVELANFLHHKCDAAPEYEPIGVRRRREVIELLGKGLSHREIGSLVAEPVHGIKNLVRKIKRCEDLADPSQRGVRGDGKNRNFTLDRDEMKAFTVRVESGWGSAQATLEWLNEYRRDRGVEPREISLKTLYTIRSRILNRSLTHSRLEYGQTGLVETLVGSRDPLIWRDVVRDRLLDCGTSRKNLRTYLRKNRVESHAWNSCWDRWLAKNGEDALWSMGEQMIGKGRFSALLKSVGAVKLACPPDLQLQIITPGQTWSVMGVSSNQKAAFIFLCNVPRIPRGGVFLRSGFAIVRGKRRYRNRSLNQQVRNVSYRKARKKWALQNSPIRISHATRALCSIQHHGNERAIERYLVLGTAKDIVERRCDAAGVWMDTLEYPDLSKLQLWNLVASPEVKPNSARSW